MDENNQKAFYMVFGESGIPSTNRHETHVSASAEAERKAKNHIGKKFYVLQTIEVIEAKLPPVTRLLMF